MRFGELFKKNLPPSDEVNEAKERFIACGVQCGLLSSANRLQAIRKYSDPSFFDILSSHLDQDQRSFRESYFANLLFSTKLTNEFSEFIVALGDIKTSHLGFACAVFDDVYISKNVSKKESIYPSSPQELGVRVRQYVERYTATFPAISVLSFNNSFFHREQILVHSKDPKHDISILNSLTQGLRTPYVTPQDLTLFYGEGRSFIPTGDFLTSKKRRNTDNPEYVFWDNLSRLKNFPQETDREKFKAAFLSLTHPQQVLFIVYLKVAQSNDLAAEHVAVALGLTKISNEGMRLLEQILPLESIHQRLILEQCGDILNGADPENSIAAFSEEINSSSAEEIGEVLFRFQLEEHARKFPEKSIDKVREEFLKPESQDSVLPGEEQLELAIKRYEAILERGQALRILSHKEIKDEISTLLKNKGLMDVPSFLIEFFALARENFKKSYGVYPYNTQIISTLLMIEGAEISESKGIYSQIKTGEGKSIIIAMLSACNALLGNSVDVVTSNSYLASRDEMRFKKFFDAFGLTSGIGDHDTHSWPKEHVDILYSTNSSLTFHYMQCRLQGIPYLWNKRFNVLIADEADNLCLDITQDSFRISMVYDPPYDAKLLKEAIRIADTSIEEESDLNPEIIQSFQKWAEEGYHLHPLAAAAILSSAFYSLELQKDADYIIKDGAIVIVDRTHTGRLKTRSHWSNGLHEIVAIQNGLKLPDSFGTTSIMTYPTMLNKYKKIFGISGTFGDKTDRDEVYSLYGIYGFDVPSHHQLQRIDLPGYIVASEEEQLEHMLEEIKRNPQQPVLILAETIAESERWARWFQEREFEPQILNDYSNSRSDGTSAEEDEIIKNAGVHGTITIATSVAGRGSDIIPDAIAKECGGVKVILGFIPYNRRVEYQGRGRAGRQGCPGDTIMIANRVSDPFITDLSDREKEILFHVIDSFGNKSHEARVTLDFMRRSINKVDSSHRLARHELSELTDKLTEAYYEIIDSALKIVGEDYSLNQFSYMRARSKISAKVKDFWIHELGLTELIVNNLIQNVPSAITTSLHPEITYPLLQATSCTIESLDENYPKIKDELRELIGIYSSRMLEIEAMQSSEIRSIAAERIDLVKSKIRELAFEEAQKIQRG